MKKLLDELESRHQTGRKSLAVLIDPDKVHEVAHLTPLLRLAKECCIDYFFVGGSLITRNILTSIIETLKLSSEIPVILFPGNNLQIDLTADAILFLCLISGRNPDLLIGQHVVAAPILKNSSIQVLPTGYMLVGNERNSSVAYMSNTTPIPFDKYSVAASTALAGQMLGLRLIYMDAGSGARETVSSRMISSVRKNIDLPLIVGGGINSRDKARSILEAGADLIVVGNALEKDPELLIGISDCIYEMNQAGRSVDR